MSGTKRILGSLSAAIGLAAFGIVASPQIAAAASTPIACTTPALIAAIAAASGGGSVTLASACVYTLTAADNTTDEGTGLPVITGTVTIGGSGATIMRSTAGGTPTFRILDVASTGNLTLDSLTISNGLMTSTGVVGGAGIYNHGTLSISGSTFTGNSSPSPNGVSGGALSNTGTMTVTTSTFTNNSAQEGGAVFNQNTTTITQSTFTNNVGTIYGGGGILNAFGTTNVFTSTFVGNTTTGGGGAIDNDTTMTVSDSTFYNNTGGSKGGGAVNNFGTITFIRSTFSGNIASNGANIHNFSSLTPPLVTATTTLSMSIVANGLSGTNCSSNGPPIVDGGYNLDTGSSCGFTTAQHSINSTQPQLLALASNGGPTQTMALPLQSPAVNAIPTSVSGCTGTDQRGVARPQDTGCDIGAYEVIITSGDTQPPTTPTGLTAPSVTAHTVSLQWNASTDNVGVTGYTVYRNAIAVGSTGGATVTTFTDVTVAPSTAYSYAVDAFDGAGNHSPKSAALPVTTTAPAGIEWFQSGAVGTPTKVTTTTLPLNGTVHAGDLLVGWFGQFDSAGQVQVSDDVNGAWTRSASTTFTSTGGDLALFYVQNAAPSPTGVTVTIAASAATFLEGAAGDYGGVAQVGALDQVAVAKGVGTAVDSGATGAVGAGELVVGGVITGTTPTSTTPGTTQGQTFTMRAQTVSGSVDIEDVLSSTAGTQNGRATLNTSADWYAVAAVFKAIPPPLAYTQSPQGNWVGTYGADGYALLGWNGSSDLVSLPQSNLVLDQGARYQWSAATTAVQGLQSPDASTRRAACFYSGSQLRLHLVFPAAYSGTLHLYALDWDSTARRETIAINDGSSLRTADISTAFNQGAWVNAPISVAAGGSLTISITRTAGDNAVLSGIFLGGPITFPAAPTTLLASAPSSSQISLSWTGSSGAYSYKIQRSPDGSTGWAQVGISNTISFTDSGLSASTTYYYRVLASNGGGDSGPSNVASATTPAALVYTQSPQGSWVGAYGAEGYALLGWNGSSDLVSLPLSTLVMDQGARHQWSAGTTAVQGLQSPDASTRRAACFYDGSQLRLHLVFPAAYSGTLHLYVLDWDSTARRETITINDGSGPQTADITTAFNLGAWVNTPINVAAGGLLTISVTRTAGDNAVLSGIFLGGPIAVPAAPTTLTASAASSTQISLSWTGSSGAYSYKIQRSADGSTGWSQVGISSPTSFTDSGLSASTTYFYRVLASNGGGDSGPSNVASSTAWATLAYTQSPQGNWVGTYGAAGYALLGWNGSSDLVSLPQSTLVLDQGARYQWSAGTTAVQGLQSPDASTRRAACFYDGSQLRLHLVFPAAYSGTLHLYAVDWDSTARRETITINDGSGPQTADITTAFDQGAWVNAPISIPAGGSLTISVTRTAGANAVLSGLFLG